MKTKTQELVHIEQVTALTQIEHFALVSFGNLDML